MGLSLSSISRNKKTKKKHARSLRQMARQSGRPGSEPHILEVSAEVKGYRIDDHQPDPRMLLQERRPGQVRRNIHSQAKPLQIRYYSSPAPLNATAFKE
jgi:hypothetical protein